MKVCLSEEMRNIDKTAMEAFGIPGVVLMENAAVSCLDSLNYFNSIVIVCGKGNNGGDGLCIARHLILRGKKVKVYLTSGSDFSGDALINYNILVKMGVTFYSCSDDDFISDLSHCDCVCDAIFGTGIKGEIKSPVKEIIENINKYSKFTLCVDIPSGVDADTGYIFSCAVKGNKTITFEAYKRGLLLYPGADYAGEIEVKHISIPSKCLEDVMVNTVEESYIQSILPKRCKNSHKGDYGRVLIIGGSKGMAGAVIFAVNGAFKVGAGLVTACVPYELNDIIQAASPEATVFCADFEHEQDKIVEKIKDFDAVLFGNGIGRESYLKNLLKKIILNTKCPLVIDADGLFALVDIQKTLKETKQPVIITPHSMEFSRLTDISVNDIESDRLGVSQTYSRENGVTLVLKGNHTIISGGNPPISYINLTGNSGMATAGSGDVLAGMVLGFLPRCSNSYDAAVISVYLHGLSGDYAKGFVGENSMTASDILSGIPHIFPVEK